MYPCLPLNTKLAGSRSSLVAMTFRLAVSWRRSRSASENSVRPVSVKFLIGRLLSVTSLFSWLAAEFMLARAARVSFSVLRSSPGSLPASALRVSASCGPISWAISVIDSERSLSLAKVLRNSATACGSSARVVWMAVSDLAKALVAVCRLRSVSVTAPILSGLSRSFSRQA